YDDARLLGPCLRLTGVVGVLPRRRQLIGAPGGEQRSISTRGGQSLNPLLEQRARVRLVHRHTAEAENEIVEVPDVALMIRLEGSDLTDVVSLLEMLQRNLVRAYRVVVELEQVVQAF